MNSKKTLSIAAIVSAFVLGGFVTYHLSSSAAEVVNSLTGSSKFGSGNHMGMRGKGGMGFGVMGIQKYIDVKNLSGDAKTTFENAEKTYQEAIKTAMEANKASGTTGDNTAFETAQKAAFTTFMTSVRSLVSSDKLTEFDAFVAAGPQKLQMGMGGHRGGMMGAAGIQDYIDVRSLSGDAKTTFENAEKTFQETMKTAMEANKASGTTGDATAMQATYKAAWTTFMTSVRSLVSSDKLTAFDAFVAAGPQKPQMGEGKEGNFGSGNHMGMRGGMGMGVQKFIDVENLSGDAKTTFENAQTAFHDSMKASMEANKASGTTGDTTAMQASMKTAWTTFMNSVRPLVSSDKLTEFDAFVAAGPQAPEKREGMGMMGKGHRGGQEDSSSESSADEGQE